VVVRLTNAFKMEEDALVYFENVDASYEKHTSRISKMLEIKGATAFDVAPSDFLKDVPVEKSPLAAH
jgi:hypothetical protein